MLTRFPKIPIPMTTSQASSQDGQVITQSAKVFNKQQGKNQLVVVIANGTGADILDLAIFPFAHVNEALANLVTVMPRGFGSRAEMIEYYKHNGTSLEGVQIDTDDVANFEESALTMQEALPDGSKSLLIENYLSDYRVATGGTDGYSKTVKLSPEEFSAVTSPLLRLAISKLKAGTKLTFKFNTVGVTKVVELSAIRAKTI